VGLDHRGRTGVGWGVRNKRDRDSGLHAIEIQNQEGKPKRGERWEREVPARGHIMYPRKGIGKWVGPMEE